MSGIYVLNTRFTYSMKHPAKGEKFSARVDRISSSGNGIINTNEGSINVGPVKESTLYNKIEFEMLTNGFAKCVGKKHRKDNYKKKMSRMCPSHFSSKPVYQPDKWGNDIQRDEPDPTPEDPDWINVGETITVEINQKGLGGTPIASYGDKEIHVPGADLDTTQSVKITKVTPSFAMGKVLEGESSDPDSEPIVQEVENEGLETNEEQGSEDISRLREQAEKSAVEEVPERVSSSTQKVPEYTRSRKIRRYVLARANGFCEGCGDPAPFTSKTGDPYLHAHHIHELSNGGSDTPDTVIALCPNCHYRVHHGDDGDDYNQELFEIVQGLEQNQMS
ncbi:HNH endonuclease [Natrinema sp. 1APR25-10V2]|uniref:HNH endonuclease n=1 Tax=Natrinema sp. 1APR25-10V2 TaxID=2951081 RepID=UPI0028754E94|nr:HNH endonuclease [Natrinema sp. 1APR25-10V2]MDS0474354.1 HNH endonuclease [Natrinema sp. 1APR25-10V2]